MSEGATTAWEKQDDVDSCDPEIDLLNFFFKLYG